MNPVVLSGQTSVTTLLIVFLASFLIWIMFVGLLFLWLADGSVKKEQILHAVFASLLSWGVAQMIKNLFPTVRPFEINGKPPLTLTIPSDGAFPSGHTAAAFGLATSLWFHNKRLGAIFLTLAIVVGISRMASNVHSFLDILGGALLGIVVAYLIEKVHLGKLLKP